MSVTSVLGLNAAVSPQCLRVFNSLLPGGRTSHEKFSCVYSESCEPLACGQTHCHLSVTNQLPKHAYRNRQIAVLQTNEFLQNSDNTTPRVYHCWGSHRIGCTVSDWSSSSTASTASAVFGCFCKHWQRTKPVNSHQHLLKLHIPKEKWIFAYMYL